MNLTPSQRARILKTFLAMDPLAMTDTGFLGPDWDSFMYEGRVTLRGLLDVAEIITCSLYAEACYDEGAPEEEVDP
jgi:hypothetical protein